MKVQVLGSSKIYMLGTVKGLVKERGKVKEGFKRVKPDCIALHISEDEVLGLESVVKGDTKEMGLSRYEELYAEKLSKYGEVQVPPPSLVEAFELGRDNEVPLIGIDLDEKGFTEIYLKEISTLHLYRHSRRFKKVKKKVFKASTPQIFSLEWDAELTRLKGFKNVEKRREEHMAYRLWELSSNYKRILAVLEIERRDGIIDQFNRASEKKMHR